MDVGFDELVYQPWDWRRRGPRKTILHGVSGEFRAGHISAIMGPSGAGKSSLMNVVTGFKQPTRGRLTANGLIRNERDFRKASCYIAQEDLLQPLLTTNESMMLAARLKLSNRISNEERKQRVADVLQQLGLTDAAETKTDRLSGGQRKRLSVALELVNNPPVLFLDEPTSGLDTVAAAQCLRVLRALAHDDDTVQMGQDASGVDADATLVQRAHTGRHTLVLTIHQPSAALLSLLDHVYVIAKGRCVYRGSPSRLLAFLAAQAVPCPLHYNPADYIIELTDREDLEQVELLSKAIENGRRCWNEKGDINDNEGSLRKFVLTNETNNKEMEANKESSIKETSLSIPLQIPSSKRSSKSSASEICLYKYGDNVASTGWQQFCVLFNRMMLQIMRNKTALKIQLAHHILCGLMIGLVYYQVADDAAQTFGHMKFCIGVVFFYTYTHLMAPVLLFPPEVKLLKKERFNGWYGLKPYYAALTISRLPFQLAMSMLFAILVYTLSGLPMEPKRFMMVYFTGVLVALAAEGMGLAIGSVFQVRNGSAVGPLAVAPMLGLAVYGFDFARQIPWPVFFLMKLSFLRCGVVTLVLVVFGMNRSQLECNDIFCEFQKPMSVLRFLDIHNTSMWSEIAILCGLIAFFRILLYIGLRWRMSR